MPPRRLGRLPHWALPELVPLAASTGPLARPAHTVTAYVVNSGSGTVTPISTATNTAGKAIKVGPGPVAIAITP